MNRCWVAAGNRDLCRARDWVPNGFGIFYLMQSAKALEVKLKKASVPSEVHIYPNVGHAFMNASPEGVERKKETGFGEHLQEAVDLAWSRTEAWFGKYLKAWEVIYSLRMFHLRSVKMDGCVSWFSASQNFGVTSSRIDVWIVWDIFVTACQKILLVTLFMLISVECW